jgi:hypothetical protein
MLVALSLQLVLLLLGTLRVELLTVLFYDDRAVGKVFIRVGRKSLYVQSKACTTWIPNTEVRGSAFEILSIGKAF